MTIVPIDEMPHLKARLGKARTDRIRYHGQPETHPEYRSTNVANPFFGLQADDFTGEQEHHLTSVLQGMAHTHARVDGHKSIPLSVSRLYNMLELIPLINTREVMKLTGLQQRQAQRYVAAVKHALPYLKDTL